MAQPDRRRGSSQWLEPAPLLVRWAGEGLLAKVHALLVGVLRGHPDLTLDFCFVRALWDTTYQIAVDGSGD